MIESLIESLTNSIDIQVKLNNKTSQISTKRTDDQKTEMKKKT